MKDVLINPPSGLLCDISSSQVSKDPLVEFQLHYFSTERRFRIWEKSKLENNITPQVQLSEGKQGNELFEIKPRQYSLNVVDEFVSNSVLKHFPHDMSCVGLCDIKSQIDISIDVFGLTRCLQNSIVMSD